MAKIKKKTGIEKGKKAFLICMTAAGVLFIASYAAFLGWKSKPQKHAESYGHTPLQQNEEVSDPVCGMKIKPPAAGHIEYRARHYYFCSKSCKEDFERDPEKYIHSRDAKGSKKIDRKEM